MDLAKTWIRAALRIAAILWLCGWTHAALGQGFSNETKPPAKPSSSSKGKNSAGKYSNTDRSFGLGGAVGYIEREHVAHGVELFWEATRWQLGLSHRQANTHFEEEVILPSSYATIDSGTHEFKQMEFIVRIFVTQSLFVGIAGGVDQRQYQLDMPSLDSGARIRHTVTSESQYVKLVLGQDWTFWTRFYLGVDWASQMVPTKSEAKRVIEDGTTYGALDEEFGDYFYRLIEDHLETPTAQAGFIRLGIRF